MTWRHVKFTGYNHLMAFSYSGYFSYRLPRFLTWMNKWALSFAQVDPNQWRATSQNNRVYHGAQHIDYGPVLVALRIVIPDLTERSLCEHHGCILLLTGTYRSWYIDKGTGRFVPYTQQFLNALDIWPTVFKRIWYLCPIAASLRIAAGLRIAADLRIAAGLRISADKVSQSLILVSFFQIYGDFQVRKTY